MSSSAAAVVVALAFFADALGATARLCEVDCDVTGKIAFKPWLGARMRMAERCESRIGGKR
mgnify:CR=1 FL=1